MIILAVRDKLGRELLWGGEGHLAVTPDEGKRMDRICLELQIERNLQKYEELVRELDELLEVKHERLYLGLKKSEKAG